MSSASVYRPGPYPEPVRRGPSGRPASGARTAGPRRPANGSRWPRARWCCARGRSTATATGTCCPGWAGWCAAGRALAAGPGRADESHGGGEPGRRLPGGAGRWPAGAYNIADERPYRRDEVCRAGAAGAGAAALPAGLARAVAAVSPTLTRYAVDQLTDGMVLDLSRARALGYRPDGCWPTIWASRPTWCGRPTSGRSSPRGCRRRCGARPPRRPRRRSRSPRSRLGTVAVM